MSTEIIEGDRLIADFEGRKRINNICEYCGEDVTMKPICNGNEKGFKINHAMGGRIIELKYHSSWSWLMPVVEKIESIHDTHHGYFGVHISSNACTIQATNFRPDKPIPTPPHYFSDWTLDSKIQSTWTAVVNFLKWYQNQILNNSK